MMTSASNPTKRLAIITRTLGDQLFLKRACASIAAALPAGVQATWIVVDDRGETTDALAEWLKPIVRPPVAVEIVRSGARHRAKALNAGLQAAMAVRPNYVHIFDDDDTIAPEFYAKTTNALETDAAIGAVATRSHRIDERHSGDGRDYRVTRRRLHYPEVKSLSLATFCVHQPVPPVAILFRAEALAEVGPADEALAVCEDYDLLLRFLLRHDIGLYDEPLACFHVRESANGERGNSAATTQFDEVDARYRNYQLRKDLAADRVGLGWLLAHAEWSRGSVKLDRVFGGMRKIVPLAFIRRWLRGA